MASGGPRQGAPGEAYPNRTDMAANRALPQQTVPGQQYGKQAEQERSMAAVPMAPPPGPPPIAPGGLPSLDSPTMRPNEPVTAGAALGPGPGTEILPQEAEGIDPDLALMAKRLPMLELMASEPSSTVAFRNYVRRLRGIVPSEQ